MAAIASISINDGKSTPVAHVFVPTATFPAQYRNGNSSASSNGLAFDETIKVSGTVNANGISKVVVELKVPRVATSDGVTPFETARAEFLIEKTATMAARKDLRVMLANALMHAQVEDTIDNLAFPY